MKKLIALGLMAGMLSIATLSMAASDVAVGDSGTPTQHKHKHHKKSSKTGATTPSTTAPAAPAAGK